MEDVVLNGRYRLLELVGSGGMAVVYRALDTVLHREVAVKVLREAYASDPAFLARFGREAQAAANLQHPNIVTVYDVGQDGDRHYIVMEYVDGQDLKTLIRQRGQLGVSEALDIAIQISSGAGHAHRMGLVHCDIKPQNVLVNEDGWAKVADFGISRALSELGLTESETVWGSPVYFSPEQAAGEPPSPSSDVYSIGIVLYEMLAGSPPFQADRAAALALMHLREEPPPLAPLNRQVPPQLEWIIRKVLSKEPAARYRAGDQLAYVLDDYRAGSVQQTGVQFPDETLGEPSSLPVEAGFRQPGADALGETPGVADRLTTILAVVAFVAVIGLVPLWVLVYRAYSASPSEPPSPTTGILPTQAPPADIVSLPDVVGKSTDDAIATLHSVGLRYVVEERDEPDARGGTVLQQRPPANQRVPADSEVLLLVSSQGRELTMPHVVSYPLDPVRAGLESDGLLVNAEHVWSGEPAGQIIGQQPAGGERVQAGDPVSLTVSGGTDVPIRLGALFADLFTLEHARLAQAVYRPGDDIALTLRWLPHSETASRYAVFIHLIGPSGSLVAQRDEEPGQPTSAWVPDRIFDSQHVLAIPKDVPVGVHQLRVGMYPSGQPGARLPVTDPGLTTAESNSVVIVDIEIRR